MNASPWRAALACAVMLGLGAAQARADLVAYYPLDEFVGLGAEDAKNDHDMEASIELGPEDVVEGRFGNAFSFNNADQTLLTYFAAGGEDLPITQHPSFTISFWVNGDYSTMGANDLRVFAEADFNGNNDPLFNLGTTNNGAGPELDYYARNSGSPNSGTHQYSTLPAFDGQWRHVAWVQDSGEATVFIDGVQDPQTWAVLDFSVLDPFPMNDTTIGGIGRAGPSHWATALIDDVSLWNEALPTPVVGLMGQGVLSPLEAEEFVFLEGDFDLNGTVDLADYDLLADNFRTGTLYTEGDVNFDGVVDLHDFGVFAAAYAAANPAAVPEPSAAALAAAAACAAVLLRRKSRA